MNRVNQMNWLKNYISKLLASPKNKNSRSPYKSLRKNLLKLRLNTVQKLTLN